LRTATIGRQITPKKRSAQRFSEAPVLIAKLARAANGPNLFMLAFVAEQRMVGGLPDIAGVTAVE